MGLFDDKTKEDDAKAEVKKEEKKVEKKAPAPAPAPAPAATEELSQAELDDLKHLGYI